MIFSLSSTFIPTFVLISFIARRTNFLALTNNFQVVQLYYLSLHCGFTCWLDVLYICHDEQTSTVLVCERMGVSIVFTVIGNDA